MSDRFSSHAPSLTGPASSGFAITPDDTLLLAETTRALFVGSGAVLTFEAVADGAILPLRIVRVLATGTTAANIIGLV
jgi:hypothetical protein